MTRPSLRERSKERRRRAIQLAGMRLFAEQGYDSTTVAQIAAAAEVSTRSVSTYFPTKLDIATSSSDAASNRLTASLSARPLGKTVVAVFLDWMRHEPDFTDQEEWQLRATMLSNNPILASTGTPHSAALLRVTAGAVAEDLGEDPASMAVQILLGVLAGVVLQFQVVLRDASTEDEFLRAAHVALTGAFEGLSDNRHHQM